MKLATYCHANSLNKNLGEHDMAPHMGTKHSGERAFLGKRLLVFLGSSIALVPTVFAKNLSRSLEKKMMKIAESAADWVKRELIFNFEAM